jgi:pimeloyl-ACP methyl ester carboxylesterase
MQLSTAVRFRAAVLATAVLFVAGCGDAVPAAPVLDHCGVNVSGAQQVSFRNAKGGELFGTVFGTGATGLVLASQAVSDRCDWEPVVDLFTARRYRVLVFDFAGRGESRHADQRSDADDVAAGVALLRTLGVSNVVLMGASLGGGAALGAALVVTPPVSAVVAVSGVLDSGWTDLTQEVAKLRMPVLYVAAAADTTYAQHMSDLYAVTVSAGSEHHVVTTTDAHGVPMLKDPHVVALITNFMIKNVPPA